MIQPKVQTRGNCQCCGRSQAVLASGRMSKHGYTVENGWFNGVCDGDLHQPMQEERSVTDRIVIEIREEIAKLHKLAEAYRAGTSHPERINRASYRHGDDPTIAWEDAGEAQREYGLRSAIFKLERRARQGENIANDLETLANKVHGKPLLRLEIDPPVRSGDRKMRGDSILVSEYTDRGRVYFKDDRGFRSWEGFQSWRRLPDAD